MAEMLAEMQEKMTNIMERNIAVENDVKGLKTALIEGFDEMKKVLVKMEDKIEENPRKRRRTASGDKENIIVAGGWDNSVEMFNWRRGTWTPLLSMSENRQGATSFVYNDHVTIAGGVCLNDNRYVDNLFTMYINPNRNLSIPWFEYPVTLAATLAYHSSVLDNDRLIVTGGSHDANHVSDSIDEVQLVPPYIRMPLLAMPEPRRGHSTQLFDDNLFIVGGSTTGSYEDNLNSVVLCDINRNTCVPLQVELPRKVSMMATVRWGDNIVVMGGRDEGGNVLNEVVIYNVRTGRYHRLPPMIYKRRGCAAVVIENNIVVLGGAGALSEKGVNEEGVSDEDVNEDVPLKSVEAFNFDRYSWEELPEMSRERFLHTAVVV